MMVRDTVPADIPALAALWTRCWHVSYAAHLAPEWTSQATEAGMAAKLEGLLAAGSSATVWTAELDDEPAALCVVAPSRDEGATTEDGELVALYVDPPRQGQGLGSMLLPVALHRLRADGFTSASVWTFASNRPALALYETAGFRPDGAEQVLMDVPCVRLRLDL